MRDFTMQNQDDDKQPSAADETRRAGIEEPGNSSKPPLEPKAPDAAPDARRYRNRRELAPHVRIARRLTETQWTALSMLAALRGPLHSVYITRQTIKSLVKLELIEEGDEFPTVTEFGRDVLQVGPGD